MTADTDRRWPPPILLRLPYLRRGLRVDVMQVMAGVTLALVIVGSGAGVWWFATQGVTWFDVALLIAMKFMTGLGITLGYHRHFSHLAFRAKPALRAALGILGSTTMQGQILVWCSVHRKHHRYSDQHGDPHSPRPLGPGFGGSVRGFAHGHFAWTVDGAYTTYVDYVPDLRRDRLVAWIDRWHWLWGAASWVLCGFVGMAWYGGWEGYWSGLFAGGPLRSLFQLNFTWAVNSVAHCAGRRRFDTRDDSRNNALVNALAMNGEGLHNNHHAFPWSARFALFKGEIDVGWWCLKLFERLGWASRLRVPSPELVARRAIPTASLDRAQTAGVRQRT
jgi:stearoyl-CoA desaturase (delta-9 desaturase)